VQLLHQPHELRDVVAEGLLQTRRGQSSRAVRAEFELLFSYFNTAAALTLLS